jgi:hypothetical protein
MAAGTRMPGAGPGPAVAEDNDEYDSDTFVAPAPAPRPKTHRGLASIESMATHATEDRRNSKAVVANLSYQAAVPTTMVAYDMWADRFQFFLHRVLKRA